MAQASVKLGGSTIPKKNIPPNMKRMVEKLAKESRLPVFPGKYKPDGSLEFDILDYCDWRTFLAMKEGSRMGLCINHVIDNKKTGSTYRMIEQADVRHAISKKVEKDTECLVRGSLSPMHELRLKEMRMYLENPIEAHRQIMEKLKLHMEDAWTSTVKNFKEMIQKDPKNGDYEIDLPILHSPLIEFYGYRIHPNILAQPKDGSVSYAISITLQKEHNPKDCITRFSNVLKNQMKRTSTSEQDVLTKSIRIKEEDLLFAEFKQDPKKEL